MTNEDIEKPPSYLSREEIEQKRTNAIYLLQQPSLVFADGQLALHPHHINGIPHLQGDYTGIDLSGMIARQSILEWVLLARANLQRVDLSGSDCCSTILRQANLEQATLVGVNFAGANLEQADFTGANLRDACLVGVDARGANFTGADLTGACAANCTLRGARFNEAILTNVDFQGADLSLASFTYAILTGANFFKAGMFPVYLYQTVFTQGQFDDVEPILIANGDHLVSLIGRVEDYDDDEERD